MKKLSILLFFIGAICSAQVGEKTIIGKITDGRLPLSNVAIVVENNNGNTFSDEAGKYKIRANVGDVLKYTYTGMKTIQIKVEDVTRVLNLTMAPDVKKLEEVVVTGSNRLSQRELESQYAINDRLIRTAYGYLNAETAPGNVRFMNEDQINTINLCIFDLLRQRFPGIRVAGTCSGALGQSLEGQLTNITGLIGDEERTIGGSTRLSSGGNTISNGKVYIRGLSSISQPRAAIFDVDGQIFTDAPIWINVSSIKRIAILNNFATTTIYGSAGAGGVVVINTFSGTSVPQGIVDRARLRNNFFSGKLVSEEQLKENWPTYLKELYRSNSKEAAMKVHESYSKMYRSSPYYFMDAYTYFHDTAEDTDIADQIIKDNFYLFKGNSVLLKGLAYIYQEQGRYDMANSLYKQILTLRSDYAQSYMDMANSYRDLNSIRQAASIYARYEYMVESGLKENDSIGFAPMFNREYNNLLYLGKEAVMNLKEAKALYVAEEDFKGTRLVFEWNDSEAEFELQFVNPGGQFFTWKHSLEANEEVIMREKEYGFSATEYLIDDSLQGTWKINAKYLGNKSLTPTYLKVTIYDNYGTKRQRKEVKVFKLSIKDSSQELFSINKQNSLVMN
jgi:tetratricopeptide (TPR) repeat protein